MGAQPPAVVRAAVGVWFALAAFVVFDNAVLWIRRGELREAAERVGDDPARVNDILLQLTLVAAVFTIGYAVLAWLLKSGKRWTRGTLTALAVVHVLSFVLPGAAAANVVPLLLIATGLALTWLPGTAQWVRQH
ncbi:hypothetical protein [Saccharothrix syringae]|uniref:Uncharacterized protein n=1 Tax=Saccharothrix syringae TaxID=103733 RepID=A0A5Q0HBM0_SACSY|nr:hypothetical protein [Saccharothrix syringae]QFZ23581.1 hypothetical protein EKG83_44595 [Saccharothrix syringae]